MRCRLDGGGDGIQGKAMCVFAILCGNECRKQECIDCVCMGESVLLASGSEGCERRKRYLV